MTSPQIDAFLSFLRGCEQSFHMAQAEELEANAITNDIHHAMELEEHSREELAELAQALAAVRRRRRAAKDSLAELGPVLTWLEDNRQVVKALERLLGDVRKAERSAENRVYTPRTNRELWHGGPREEGETTYPLRAE